MAFTLQALIGTTTYNLNNGSPYSLENANGFGLPPIVRYEQTSPLQHGATDIGYDLDPRILTLALSFSAADDATLDGYRDDLNVIFGPGHEQIVKLRVTRDDGAIRQLDTYCINDTIEIIPAHRPGHLHKAAIQLRAADPRWYNPTPGTVTLTQPVTEWWTGGGAVGTASVMTYVGTPTPDETWGWAGTISAVADAGYTVIWRAAYIPGTTGATDQYAWTSGTAGTPDFFLATDAGESSPFRSRSFTDFSYWTEAMQGTVIYVLFKRMPYDYSVGTTTLTQVGLSSFWFYSQTTGNWYSLSDFQTHDKTPFIGGGYWGGNGAGTATQWGTILTHCAVYSGIPKISQIFSVVQSIVSQVTIGTANRVAAVSYPGNAIDFPVITITGPISDAVLTNAATGDRLDFTGATIPSGATYTIDLSADSLAVSDSGGTVRTDKLTADSDLGTWSIVPDPLATGGTNTIFLDGTAVGPNTQAKVVYYNRYLSY